MIRYALILILTFAFCPASAATGEVSTNRTVWVMSGQPVRITMLPPHGDVTSCTAVPPLFCEQINDKWFIALDPEGLPPHTEMHQWVTYTAGNESCSQLVDITIRNLAPSTGNVNLSAIPPTDLLDDADEVMRSHLSTLMMVCLLAILYANRRKFR